MGVIVKTQLDEPNDLFSEIYKNKIKKWMPRKSLKFCKILIIKSKFVNMLKFYWFLNKITTFPLTDDPINIKYLWDFTVPRIVHKILAGYMTNIRIK